MSSTYRRNEGLLNVKRVIYRKLAKMSYPASKADNAAKTTKDVSEEAAKHVQSIEMQDDDASGAEKFSGEARPKKNPAINEPMAQKKKAPPLLGNDEAETLSECDCRGTTEPCGTPEESTSLVSECCCDGYESDVVPATRLGDSANYTADVEESGQTGEGRKAKINFNMDTVETTGKFQSPIDIKLNELVVKNYPALEFSKMYYEPPDHMFTVIQDNTYEVYSTYTHHASPRIINGPLKSPYKFLKFVFQWGSEDGKGSEHTVDGKAYVMELHAVHIQEQLSKKMALSYKSGFAILAYFIQIGKTDHPAIEALLDNFERLDEMTVQKDQEPFLSVEPPLSVSNLIDTFSESYVTYEGSLTTEPFSENVTWILSPYCLRISPAQMAKFRSLKGVKPNNFREIQQRHGRVIYIVDREDNIFRRLEKTSD